MNDIKRAGAPMCLGMGSNQQTNGKDMKKLKATLWVAVCASALLIGTGRVQAQRGDPAQWRQNRIDRLKEEMDVKDDAEWKLIEAGINKVMDAQMALMADRGRAMFGRRNRGGDTSSTSSSDNGGRRGGFFGQPSPEVEDLQKAIDNKAPAEEIKAKLAKVREASAAKEANLAKAQDELKALLTSRQEAIAVLNGLLK
ncbi:MAG TPA: hypothetical protein VFB72_04995 [Verrucomicrobiae bacterium]|nr:hypothetical protein [Verrucomicrobiae bacterium]